jgi:hypothetical protein
MLSKIPLFPADCGGCAATVSGKRVILGRRRVPSGCGPWPPQTPPPRKSCKLENCRCEFSKQGGN